VSRRVPPAYASQVTVRIVDQRAPLPTKSSSWIIPADRTFAAGLADASFLNAATTALGTPVKAEDLVLTLDVELQGSQSSGLMTIETRRSTAAEAEALAALAASHALGISAARATHDITATLVAGPTAGRPAASTPVAPGLLAAAVAFVCGVGIALALFVAR
jgi:hypothetical protein